MGGLEHGAGRLAGVLGECKAADDSDVRKNEMRAEGARKLAGVLGVQGARSS